jgi:hypothetical protein
MRHPHILPGFTDAGAHSRNLAYFDGALAVLRQAVTDGFLAPEKAVARVTGEAARWFNIDAGEIREGARADLVLLRPQALRQPAPAPVEIDDLVLGGARRMVKRGSEAVVSGVYVAGREVVRDGAPLPCLGEERSGALLTPVAKAQGRRAVLERYRNRIDDEHIDHPFSDYWDVFVLKHQRPANVALHCLGVVLIYAGAAAALVTGNPWWLLFITLSQATGLAGHLLFERSHVDARDAVFSWRASCCLNRMLFAVICGRYWKEVGRVRRQYAGFRGAPV